jgi:hypothetical protein
MVLMFLYSRAVALGGSPRRTMPWIQSVTDHVRGATPLDVTVWAAEFGHPIGSTVWNALVESQKELDEATSSLLADDGYLDLVDAGQEMLLAPAEDALRSLLHGAPADAPTLGSVASVTTATMAVDRVADALAWSVEMATHAEKTTGNPVTCWSSAFGQMGEVIWISVMDDLAAADASHSALNGDEGYISRLHDTGELFIPGSGHVARFRRIH